MAFFRRKAAAPSAPCPSSSGQHATTRVATSETKRKNRMSVAFKSTFSLGKSAPAEAVAPTPSNTRRLSSMAAPATSERKPSNRVDASRRHTMAITEDVLASLDTGTPPSQSQGISRHSRIESLRPLPPLPPPEEMLVNVGLGLLNTTLTSDSEEGTSSDTPSSAEPAVARRISLPPTITAPSLRTGTSDTASTQARRRVSAIVTSTSDSTTPAAQVLTSVRVDVATSRRVEHSRLSASGPPSAGLRARQGSTGTAGSRERIARLRAEWSALSAAEVESNGMHRGRFGPRSNSMYELKAPSATSARRASSATISDGSGSRRSSTASSLKPLKLEKAASHPTLRPLLNKPIPAPPRPTRSSARYCLRPTRDFSTQTPADWNQPQSPETLTGGASVGERLRNHRRGSSWGNASHLAPGTFSPSDDSAPSLPPIPGHFSPSPSRYGAPSPSVYSVASFETTNRGWTRASQVSRHTMPLGIFEDLQQIDEAASSPIPDEAAATEILHGDDPFADYRILPSVTEMSRAPSVDADPASPPYPSSATPTPAARSSLVGDEDAYTSIITKAVVTPAHSIEHAVVPILLKRDSHSSSSEQGSEHSCELGSPPTSVASSICSGLADLSKQEVPLVEQHPQEAVPAAPTFAVVFPEKALAPMTARDDVVLPAQLSARRFSETDKPIPRPPRASGLSAADRAARGRSYFLVQALMGEAPTEGLVRDWAQDADSDDGSDGVSLLGQPTSDESDAEE
ncbi:hypothetical protein B0A53_00334 [Rhodotorula sp. CCFEE 5036]|nr:hypothetical protein B0A53_00334 [Rhodotorula sp. CCFEE 5036]